MTQFTVQDWQETDNCILHNCRNINTHTTQSLNASYILQLTCIWVDELCQTGLFTEQRQERFSCLILSRQAWPSVINNIIPHIVLKVISCSTVTQYDILTDWSQGVRQKMSLKLTVPPLGPFACVTCHILHVTQAIWGPFNRACFIIYALLYFPLLCYSGTFSHFWCNKTIQH